ncbi:MAG: hypothetical protein F6K24_13795 [Okeania sp. SIO2D1]|nr:hypothetical protein [Okeania sp. SIO2D1]
MIAFVSVNFGKSLMKKLSLFFSTFLALLLFFQPSSFAGRNITITDTEKVNPDVFLDTLSLSRPDQDYVVADYQPPGDFWIEYSQFCSVMSLTWLHKTQGREAGFKFNDYTDNQKFQQTNVVIDNYTPDSQVNYAVRNLPGVQLDKDSVIDGLLPNTPNSFPVGSKIWLGADLHVLGIYILDKDRFLFYDSEVNRVETLLRSRAREELFPYNVFVVDAR